MAKGQYNLQCSLSNLSLILTKGFEILGEQFHGNDSIAYNADIEICHYVCTAQFNKFVVIFEFLLQLFYLSLFVF